MVQNVFETSDISDDQSIHCVAYQMLCAIVQLRKSNTIAVIRLASVSRCSDWAMSNVCELYNMENNSPDKLHMKNELEFPERHFNATEN